MATFKRIVVTLLPCVPRLFEILTTLTFGSQRRNHIVSAAFETIAKNKEGSLSMCDQQFIMNCQEHNRSWKRSASSVGVVALAAVWWKKKVVASVTANDICNSTRITSLGIYFHYGFDAKTISVSKKQNK